MQVAYPSSPAYPQAVRLPGPSLRASLITMIVGLVIAIPSFVMFLRPFFDTLGTNSMNTPSTVTKHLDAGENAVYVGRNTQLSAADVTVTSASGVQLPMRGADWSTTESITRGTEDFYATVYFDVPEADQYTITVNQPGEVIVTRSLTATAESSIGWFFVAFLGGIAALVGLIMTIVGAVRRKRAREMQLWYGPPQAWQPPY